MGDKRLKLFFLSAFLSLAAIFIFSNVKIVLAFDAWTDSDGDGYSDGQEIANGYSPVNPADVKIEKSDMDNDGLSDYWELKFKTDPLKADTDGDGYSDNLEVDSAHDPLAGGGAKLDTKIEIDTKIQKLTLFIGGQPWKKFPISSGQASMPTPTGAYSIINKIENAWSNSYGLWMPYWLGLDKGQFGIHELPIWPSGYREGEDHLGTPVSHGCIRLGIGPAQYIYERAAVGTEVDIK